MYDCYCDCDCSVPWIWLRESTICEKGHLGIWLRESSICMDFESVSFDSVSSTYMVTGEFHMRGFRICFVRLCVVVVILD